jgi:hypothetical protein
LTVTLPFNKQPNKQQNFNSQTTTAKTSKIMKTIITTIACAFALTTSVAFAHPTTEGKTKENKTQHFDASAYVTNDASIRVAVKKNTVGRVYVSLRDAKGELIYGETVGKKDMAYAAKFNVSELQDGAYTLEMIGNNGERIVKKLNLKSEKLVADRKVTVE